MSLGHEPLAQRLRPRDLSEFLGQEHLVGPGRVLRVLWDQRKPASIVFWGPPGVGKTTLARLLATRWEAQFVEFSAVSSGVGQVREVVEAARRWLAAGRRTVLFVDEIHRFNKAQQDAFLPHVESGLIVLLGATTENPSFELIPPLLSRVRVVVMHPLGEAQLEALVERALSDAERGLGGMKIELSPRARQALVAGAMGDGRRLLNALELAVELAPLGEGGVKVVGHQEVAEALGARSPRYDKAGDQHYDMISAFIKSLRGSDPDAALYWMGRMLVAGEDPRFIMRRMAVVASEDIGLADPYAMDQVAAAAQVLELVGLPEAELAMAQAAVYLALAPKSNAIYKAWGEAKAQAEQTPHLEVPLHLRNAPTGLMRSLGYGRDYLYPHDFPAGVAPQQYLPATLRAMRFYRPSAHGRERAFAQRLEQIRRLRKQEE